MKKIIVNLSLILLLITALSFTGCSSKQNLNSTQPSTNDSGESESTTVETTVDQNTQVNEDIQKYEITNGNLLCVNDKYILSSGAALYMKDSPTGELTMLCSLGSKGFEQINSMMSDGNTIFFSCGPATSNENEVLFSYSLEEYNLEELLMTNSSLTFATFYNNCIYYLDGKSSNSTFNKYNIKENKNEIIEKSILNIDNDNYIRSIEEIGQKIYYEITDDDARYGEFDIGEFDLFNETSKIILENSSIVQKHRYAQQNIIYFQTFPNEEWYLYSVDMNGNLKKSVAIPSKLTLNQGVINCDGAFALMASNSNESDFDLYKVDLETGDIKIFENGAGGFKNKGSGLGYDLKNRENIYLVGGGSSIKKFNGSGYDEYQVDGEYDPYFCYVVDDYVINRDLQFLKINID